MLCIHFDCPELCDKCKKNKEALGSCAWKENRWHLSRYESVIGHKQTKQAVLR